MILGEALDARALAPKICTMSRCGVVRADLSEEGAWCALIYFSMSVVAQRVWERIPKKHDIPLLDKVWWFQRDDAAYTLLIHT